jgi:hypothetical protein
MTRDKRAGKVNLDFHADFRIIVVKVLALNGIDVDHNEPYGDAVYRLFANMRRRMEARPYRVLEAAELVCPPDVASGYAELKSELEQGIDVTARLSRKASKATYEDGMLNDWGITHLHLGLRGAQGGVPPTNPVLFALVRDDVVYAIGFFAHGAWSDIEVLEIVRRNWPDLMERVLAKGMTVPFNVNDEERAQRRAAGISSLITVDGQVYGAIGGGYTSARTSMAAHWQTDRAILSVDTYEKHVRDNLATFLKQIEATGRIPGTPPTFRFWVDHEGRACAMETMAGANIILGPFPL